MVDFITLAGMTIALQMSGNYKTVYLPTLFYVGAILTMAVNPLEVAVAGFVASFFGGIISNFIRLGRKPE